MVTNKSP